MTHFHSSGISPVSHATQRIPTTSTDLITAKRPYLCFQMILIIERSFSQAWVYLLCRVCILIWSHIKCRP